jgi:MshEN domain
MSSLFREGTLGAILFKSGIITEKDIETALEEQKRSGLRFGEALVSLGIVMQEDIDWALSNQLDIPYARIRPESVDPAAIQLVPAAIARKFNLFPLIRTGDELRIAIADPLNREAVTEVERVSGCSASISMGLLREIREMQDLFYGPAAAMESLGFSSESFPAAAVEEINSDVAGLKLFDYLINYLLQNELTSLSLKPLLGRVEIAAREKGVTKAIGSLGLKHYVEVLATLKKMSGVFSDIGISASGIFAWTSRGERKQVQAELMKAGPWEYVTIKPMVGLPFPGCLDDFDASAATGEILKGIAAAPAGIVLAAAPDHESRVRLMEIMVQESAGKGRDVVLIGKSFAFSGGRFPVVPIDRGDHGIAGWITAALAHEPAVIAVEDLSDDAALWSAIDAEHAGKLLYGGMRVDGVRGLLGQLCSLRKGHPALPGSLRGLLAVRITPILCRACRAERDVDRQEIPLSQGFLPPVLFRPQGCHACGYTGYAEKRILVEAIAFDGNATRLFDTPPGCDDIDFFLKQQNFHGIADEAAAMLRDGDITVEAFAAMTRDRGEQPWQE